MNKRAYFIVMASMAILLSSCVNREENQTTIKTTNQTLIMNSSNTDSHDPFTVQPTDLLEGIQGIRWNSDHEIVYIKTLKTETDRHNQPVYKSIEGVKDLLTGGIKGEKVWDPGEMRIPSPDSKYIYVVDTYMEGENIYALHTIENENSGQVMEISLKAVSGVSVWLNNEHVLYMGGIGDGGVVQIDLQGHITPLPEFSKLMEQNDTRFMEYVTKVGDRLYYLETDYPKKVHYLNYIQISQIHKPSALKIREDISQFKPAPDGQRIAVVSTETKLDATKHELFLIDPDGNQMGKSIATGGVIEHLAWSLDNLKLAYGILGVGKGYQIKVFDMRTSENSVVFEGCRINGDLLWSPDSKQLMVPIDRSQNSSEALRATNILKFR